MTNPRSSPLLRKPTIDHRLHLFLRHLSSSLVTRSTQHDLTTTFALLNNLDFISLTTNFIIKTRRFQDRLFTRPRLRQVSP